MAIELFGFSIGRVDKDEKNKKSFALPEPEDGALEVGATGGAYGTYVDLEGVAKNEIELIKKYRDMSQYPEADQAIDDIINEAVVTNRENQPVTISLEKSQLSENIKHNIKVEFHEIMRLLDFRKIGYEIFRKWYVDGRLYYHIIIDPNNTKRGILELRPIDALKIKKVRQILPPKDPSDLQAPPRVEEYFSFNDGGMDGKKGGQIVRVAPDSIAYAHSGLLNEDRKMVLSYLHKAIKPLNQLRMIEDAVVIYRIARAPERRIFYIDVGNLPKPKAEAYMKDIMSRYRNKVVYDSNTGEIMDDRNQMSMLEDFWLPRREGGRGTDVTTLSGGQNLGELEDIKYFQKKLYKSLNIPISRLESEGGFNLGKSTEITRDEIKFSKFIQRLRKKFGELFQDLLKTQLILKGIITAEDWNHVKEFIVYDFKDDNHFQELKEIEILNERLTALQAVNDYVGTYYSVEYVRRYVLRQSDTEIEEIDKQIKQEKKDDVMDDDAGLDPGRPVGSNMPEPEAPVEAPPMNGNGAATVPGGDEGQADADQEYSGPETA